MRGDSAYSSCAVDTHRHNPEARRVVTPLRDAKHVATKRDGGTCVLPAAFRLLTAETIALRGQTQYRSRVSEQFRESRCARFFRHIALPTELPRRDPHFTRKLGYEWNVCSSDGVANHCATKPMVSARSRTCPPKPLLTADCCDDRNYCSSRPCVEPLFQKRHHQWRGVEPQNPDFFVERDEVEESRPRDQITNARRAGPTSLARQGSGPREGRAKGNGPAPFTSLALRRCAEEARWARRRWPAA